MSEANQWKHMATGDTGSVQTPRQNYQEVLRGGAQGIMAFHTHPPSSAQTSARKSPPSSGDVLYSAYMNSYFGSGPIDYKVADGETVWVFDATLGTPFVSLTTAGVKDGWFAFADPIDKRYSTDADAKQFVDDFAKQDISTTEKWLAVAWSMLAAAKNGKYGTAIQSAAQEYAEKIAGTPLFEWWNSYGTCSGNDALLGNMMKIYETYGVTIEEEDHPYKSCSTDI